MEAGVTMGSNVATGVGPGRGVGAGAWVGNGNTVACGIWRVGAGGAGMDETGVGAAGGTPTISGHGVGNEGVAVGGATRGLSVGPEGTTTMTWFGTGTGNALDVGGGGRLSAGPSAKGSSWKPASGEGCADLPPIEQSPPRSLQETRTRARISGTRRSLKRLAFAVGNKARIQWWELMGYWTPGKRHCAAYSPRDARDSRNSVMGLASWVEVCISRMTTSPRLSSSSPRIIT